MPSVPDVAESPSWIRDPALASVWGRIADALERKGLVAIGVVVVDTQERAVRHAVGDLLGRPVTGEHCRIDLANLDERIRQRAGTAGGLVEVASGVTGRRLVDRPATRNRRLRRRTEPFDAAAQWLDDHPQVAAEPWVAPWLDGLRRDGVLSRRMDGSSSVVAALDVLDALGVGGSTAGVARTQLAAAVLHDAHGLDDGSPVAQLVLRAVACAQEVPVPRDAGGRRDLWQSAGVAADAVSSTCLTFGLRWERRDPASKAWDDAAERGDPLHLTRWDLDRSTAAVRAPSTVLVCENPRVLEAVAQSGTDAVAVVCASGRPNLVVQEVLRRCAAASSRLHYHGDFDWSGIAIAHQVMDLCGAVPWRMGADDYLAAPSGIPLTGVGVEARWDDDLAAAMRSRGVAVHEEAVLDSLLDALDDISRSSMV